MPASEVPHKLRTVMFADVSGYTALMEQDEGKALEILHQFKEIINANIHDFSGSVIHYYGDGCLIVFDSVIDGVNGALKLQQEFQKSGNIPVRIGMHLGDVVVDSTDIYGDTVNIASRIESIGIPGSILFTEEIYGQIQHRLSRKCKYLGTFYFKNVSNALKVYAFTGDGLAVPNVEQLEGKLQIPLKTNLSRVIQKKSGFIPGMLLMVLIGILFFVRINNNNKPTQEIVEQVKRNGITVMPFANETGSPELDFIGATAMNLLAEGLRSSGQIEVRTPYFIDPRPHLKNIQNYEGYNSVDQSVQEMNYILTGRYYLLNDSIFMSAFILNAYTLEFSTQLAIAKDNSSSFRNVLDEIEQKVLGFWLTKDNPYFQQKTPLRDSYIEYNKAISQWEKSPSEIFKHLRNCLQVDSSFVRGYLLEIVATYIYRTPEKTDSLIKNLERRNLDLSQSERNYFYFLKALNSGNNKLAHDYFFKEYKLAREDLFINSGAVSNAMTLINNPQEAIEVARQVDWRLIDYSDCSYCLDRIEYLALALMAMDSLDQAWNILSVVESRQIDTIDMNLKLLQVRVLVHQKKWSELHEFLEKSRTQDFTYGDQLYLYGWATQEAFLEEEIDHALELGQQTLALIPDQEKPDQAARLSQIYFCMGEFSKVEYYLKRVVAQFNESLADGYQLYYLGKLGYALGREHKVDEAITMIQALDTFASPYLQANCAYAKAQIWLGLNAPDKAIEFLEIALDKGQQFHLFNFEYDPVLVPLKKNVAYRQLLRRYN
ncbi:MAG: adenylate/guanylate cyclase domain-containing protein [Saprospiraceae bacterium]